MRFASFGCPLPGGWPCPHRVFNTPVPPPPRAPSLVRVPSHPTPARPARDKKTINSCLWATLAASFSRSALPRGRPSWTSVCCGCGARTTRGGFGATGPPRRERTLRAVGSRRLRWWCRTCREPRKVEGASPTIKRYCCIASRALSVCDLRHCVVLWTATLLAEGCLFVALAFSLHVFVRAVALNAFSTYVHTYGVRFVFSHKECRRHATDAVARAPFFSPTR